MGKETTYWCIGRINELYCLVSNTFLKRYEICRSILIRTQNLLNITCIGEAGLILMNNIMMISHLKYFEILYFLAGKLVDIIPNFSIKIYNKALSVYLKNGLNIDFIGILLDIAINLDILGRKDEAILVYKKAIEINPLEARAYYGLAIIYDDLKDFENAVKLYERAIEIDPEYAEAYFFLANVLDESGEKEKAAEYYEKAAKIEPDHFWAYNNLAAVYEDLGKYDKALTTIRKGLELEPNNYRALFNAGVIMNKLGYSNKAKDYYIKSIVQNSKYSYTYLNLSIVYLEENDYQNAIDIISKGIRNCPKTSFLYYNRACFYVRLGELDLAIRDLFTAINLSKELEEYMKKDKELDPLRDMERYKKRFGIL